MTRRLLTACCCAALVVGLSACSGENKWESSIITPTTSAPVQPAAKATVPAKQGSAPASGAAPASAGAAPASGAAPAASGAPAPAGQGNPPAAPAASGAQPPAGNAAPAPAGRGSRGSKKADAGLPDAFGGFQKKGAPNKAAAGDAYSYADPQGRALIVVLSSQPDPDPAFAQTLTADRLTSRTGYCGATADKSAAACVLLLQGGHAVVTGGSATAGMTVGELSTATDMLYAAMK